MTAEEYLNNRVDSLKESEEVSITDLMIEFAKYHVQEALKEASGEAPIYCGEGIKNCYPLENVK